jgi:imidazolonepropionase-like amidohydrolase
MQCVKADTLYTGHSVLENVFLGFEQGLVAGVFDEPRGELLGEYRVVTPALIDPHSHIGMVRSGEPENEAEANDHQDSLMVKADALDSLQMDDPALKDAVEMGVLYSCIVPGSGNILGGLSAVIRNYGLDSNQALICRAGLKAALGYNPMSTSSWEGTRATTRMGSLAILRKKLEEVRRKEQRFLEADGSKKDEITFSAEEDTLREVLAGRLGLRVHVHKTDDIATLLRLVDEFGIRVTVEHAMGVHQPGIFHQLRARRIQITYGPLDAFAYKVELKHESWRNIEHLIDSGVKFGLMSDHPVTPARQILLQTRWFLRFGYSRQEALELVTRRNSQLLGLDRWLGTLEESKWASFVCWSSDPFELWAFPVAVYGEGRLLHEEPGAQRP